MSPGILGNFDCNIRMPMENPKIFFPPIAFNI
jgi:hypothetical protein